MAQKEGALTPTRSERRPSVARPWNTDLNPFTALQRMAEEMDRMFDDFGPGRSWARPFWRESGTPESGTQMWAPQVEISQKNNELTIRADLPGLKREDVTVDITDTEVSIQGERRHEREDDREGYYRSERSYGSFYRVIPLPDGAISDQAKATFKDGVLEITLPAPPASKGRRLEIADAAKK